jgi:hypothetical protein
MVAKPRFTPPAHLWASRPWNQPSELPREVVVKLDGERRGVRLTVCGWLPAEPASGWTYERITKNLDELAVQWAELHGEFWTLEVREAPRRLLPAMRRSEVVRNVRIRVGGWLEFRSPTDMEQALHAALDHEHDTDCAFDKTDCHVRGARFSLDIDDRMPTACWNATVRALMMLRDTATAGEMTAALEAGETVVRLSGGTDASSEDDTNAGSAASLLLGIGMSVNGVPCVDHDPLLIATSGARTNLERDGELATDAKEYEDNTAELDAGPAISPVLEMRAPVSTSKELCADIGVIGLSGVGKSSLLNALLAPGRQVLPAGGIGPLTGLPLRIIGADEPSFRVQYRSRHWLTEQVRLLGGDVTQASDLLGRLALVCTGDQHTTRDPAWLLQALGYAIDRSTAAPIEMTQDVSYALHRFRGLLGSLGGQQRYRLSDGESAFFEKLRLHTAGQFAPLCECVELAWPAPLLTAGVTLRDLPGLGSAHDSHASHAVEWLRTARTVLLVVDRAGLPEVVLEAMLTSGFFDRLLRCEADLVVAITKLDLVADDAWRAAQPRRPWSEYFFQASRRATEQLELHLHTALLTARRGLVQAAGTFMLHDVLSRVAYCGVSSREHHRLAEPDEDQPRVESPESTGIPALKRAMLEVVEGRRAATNANDHRQGGSLNPGLSE